MNKGQKPRMSNMMGSNIYKKTSQRTLQLNLTTLLGTGLLLWFGVFFMLSEVAARGAINWPQISLIQEFNGLSNRCTLPTPATLADGCLL